MSLTRIRIIAGLMLVCAGALGYFIYTSEYTEGGRAFKYGLDLQGGSQLTYTIDTSPVEEEEVGGAVASLRDVIERRVNLFGVSEPVVQTEVHEVLGVSEYRLLVELPGVTDLDEATTLIGDTPYLEFREEASQAERESLEALLREQNPLISDENVQSFLSSNSFVPTDLNGRFLKSASVQFSQQGGLQQQPVVVLEFNKEGAERFSELTEAHLGRPIAVYLDGAPISIPVVRDRITDGVAVVSGDFTVAEARELSGRFNAGALPLPIELVATNRIGATLGAEALDAGMVAGLIGFSLVALFMLVWYRLPGLVAVVSLLVYLVVMLSIFKLVPVTLTAAGIAGFVLSLGLAVDANVLIFERLKEELLLGKEIDKAILDGFARAWRSIRDSNMSSILSAIILFWFGSSLIEGFALVFGIGTLVSMLTAISISRSFLFALVGVKTDRRVSSLGLFMLLIALISLVVPIFIETSSSVYLIPIGALFSLFYRGFTPFNNSQSDDNNSKIPLWLFGSGFKK